MEPLLEVRELSLDEVLRFETVLKQFLYDVLSENISYGVTFAHAEAYYKDLVKFANEGSAVVIGALLGKELIGFHWGYEVTIFGQRRMHSYLNAVSPLSRGQGVGKKFWLLLEQITRSRGITVIEAMVTYSNEVAMNYHLTKGFEIERVKVCKLLEKKC